MASNGRMSRRLDEHRFDALAASVAPEPSNIGVMLLDRDLRIRGANTTFEAVSLRQRDEMLDERYLASLTRDIANSLRELHRLNADAKQLKASVDALKSIYEQLTSLRSHLSEARAREIAMTAAQIAYHERREQKHTETLAQQVLLASR